MNNDANPLEGLTGAVSKLADLTEGIATASMTMHTALAKTLIDKGLISAEDFHRNIDLSRSLIDQGEPNRYTDTIINVVKGLTNNGK